MTKVSESVVVLMEATLARLEKKEERQNAALKETRKQIKEMRETVKQLGGQLDIADSPS